jgi:hypothetical protein
VNYLRFIADYLLFPVNYPSGIPTGALRIQSGWIAGASI